MKKLTRNTSGFIRTPFGTVRKVHAGHKGDTIVTHKNFLAKKGSVLTTYGTLTFLTYDQYVNSQWFEYGVEWRKKDGATTEVAVPACSMKEAMLAGNYAMFINAPDADQHPNCRLTVSHQRGGRISVFATRDIGINLIITGIM